MILGICVAFAAALFWRDLYGVYRKVGKLRDYLPFAQNLGTLSNSLETLSDRGVQ